MGTTKIFLVTTRGVHNTYLKINNLCNERNNNEVVRKISLDVDNQLPICLTIGKSKQNLHRLD